ncbi:SDR family NAD(P)-dependent oxidoreductase [Leptospira langatensis]|uniref:SDR family NAD(P)-dependent oxidoreductase n=1 Tax=Leptospira langatensis TaxID=2484983 RepID=A0A5F1ZRY8_9LEPT|nr:SDR family NAD(P)-dependent oxidoreductase [Leptospira langatensis]TGK01963.1 SDR family NAD(P)-dependent oxidoreductase [Leptospira langatensis]TGL39321.1 SDR family NAD(P)-dependent oxidoreductase [Leptospira langatensis]
MRADTWVGKTIVITGGSSGIGASLLDLLSKVPCKIINLSRTEPELIQRVAKGKEKRAATLAHISVDLSSEKEINKAATKISKLTDGIDVLFNNAGVTAHSRFDQTQIEAFRKAFDINFFGPVFLTLRLLPYLKKNKGSVMVTSTVSGLYGIPARSAYSSSKSALHAVMESARIELSEEGLRFIIFCPPYTKTNLRANGIDGDGNQLSESHYSGKSKTPLEVANKMIQAIEDPNSRLVVMDKSGWFLKWMRNISPSFLEKVLYKKLYKDFH